MMVEDVAFFFFAYLSPVRENLAVSAVGDKLLGELRHLRIEVIADHEHYSSGLNTFRFVFVDRQGSGTKKK